MKSSKLYQFFACFPIVKKFQVSSAIVKPDSWDSCIKNDNEVYLTEVFQGLSNKSKFF